MLDVFITVDVEVWCDGWNDLDTKFPNAFKRYIYGPTSGGNYGLPYQLCNIYLICVFSHREFYSE